MVTLGELARTGDGWAEQLGRRLPELCALYPVLWTGVAYHLAWLAQLQLGRWPRPNLDDPRALGGLVPALHLVLTLQLVLWPVSWAAGLLGVGLHARASGWRGAALRLLVLVVANSLMVAFARWDPGQVMAWVMD